MNGSTATARARTAMIAALSFCVVSSVSADEIAWQTDIRSAHRQAQQSGKPMLIQLTASWCHYCRKMKATTYTDAKVCRSVTANYIPIMLDADKHPETVRKLNLRGLPATVIVAPNLVILNKLNGYQTSQKLTAELTRAQHSMRKISSVGYAKTAEHPTPRSTVPTKSPRSATTRKPVQPTIRTRPVAPAFGGLSLVALREGRELKIGTAEFQTQHAGKVLYFTNKAELAEFKKSPERYWPRHGGQCVVSASTGQQVPGRPEFGVLFDGSVWMFETADKMRHFVENPGDFAARTGAN